MVTPIKNTDLINLNDPNIKKEIITKDEQMTTNINEIIDSFDELNLKDNLLRGIYGYGWNNPSYIQQIGIKPILDKRDIIAQAQSGSGKTGCFTVGALQLIDPEVKEVQVLILSPTRDLAYQSFNVFNFLGEFMKVKSLNVIGGTSNTKELIENLKNGVHTIIGTPGKIIWMIEKNFLKLTYLKFLVLDEADVLLQKGFLADMKKTIELIPKECQIGLFSATMPKEIVEITEQFMNNPAKILVQNDEIAVKGIKQFYISVKKEWKLETLSNLYKALDIAQAIIFCNSKKGVESLAEEMKKQGHMISAFYSELEISERIKVMREFREGVTRVLIATDIAARGIDVYSLNIVINYDFPRDNETYIHRIGRAGRFGKKGNSITFVLPDEQEEFEKMKKLYNMPIEKLPSDLSLLNI